MPSEIQISQLFNSKSDSDSRAICFIAPQEKAQWGQLFILGQMPKTGQDFLNAIKEKLLASYYSSHPLDGSEEADIEARLENVLESTNIKLEEVAEGIDRETLEGLDLVIGITHGEKVFFTQRGKAGAYLIRNSKITRILEPQTESHGQASPSKIFSHIISGALEAGSSLIFSTSNFLDYFSEETLIKTVSDLSPLRACEYLAGLLGSESCTLGAIVIKAQSPEPALPEKERELKEEPHVVSPSRKIRIEAPDIEPEILLVHRKPGIMRTIGPLISCGKKILKSQKGPRIFSQGIAKLRKRVLGPDMIGLLSREFKNLGASSKILLAIILILVIIFVQSIAAGLRKEIRRRESEAYMSLIGKVQEKQNEVSATLIYQDKVKAKKLLEDLEYLLNALPKNTAERQATFENFSREKEKYIDELYNVQKITPQILSDFSILGEGIEVGGIEKIGPYIYAWNPLNNQIFSLNLKDNEARILNETSKNIGYLKYATSEGERIVFFHDGKGLALYSPAKNTLTGLELVSETQRSPKDISAYGGNLYLLSPEENQIYKYLATIEGFGKEEAWIKEENFDIKEAVSIAIDGAVYILKSDGNVLKLYKGERVDFNLEPVQPRFVSPAKLYTNPDLNLLYILDPAGQRLVIFDKKGQLRTQYTSPAFDKLKDFAVDKTENKIYLLNGTKIFEIK